MLTTDVFRETMPVHQEFSNVSQGLTCCGNMDGLAYGLLDVYHGGIMPEVEGEHDVLLMFHFDEHG